MNITLEADYAVKIVDCLALNYPKRVDATTLSLKTGVTLRFSLKILHKLAVSGIVCSFKGAKGGYELTQSPEKITLREVIETVEGPFIFSRCLAPGHICTAPKGCQKTDCRFQKVYDEISEDVRKKLEQVTFGK
ncbi:MAG: Rrf2 family transcriptional regulator [Oscillospiraceae bacterium]